MREIALREYAETKRRELTDVRKKLHEAIDASSTQQQTRDRVVTLLQSRKRRGRTAPPKDNPQVTDEVTRHGTPAADHLGTDWFARELGSGWVEVEPGIYEQASLRSAERAGAQAL